MDNEEKTSDNDLTGDLKQYNLQYRNDKRSQQSKTPDDINKKQVLKKWEKAAIKALKNKDYLQQCKEFGEIGCDFYD